MRNTPDQRTFLAWGNNKLSARDRSAFALSRIGNNVIKISNKRLGFTAASTLAATMSFSLLAALPALAQQPNGYPVTNVNLRAGPSVAYPIIVTVPGRAPITILGCLPDYSWCDSVFQGNRGWMRSIYLSGYYRGAYYALGDYAPRLGYRTVSFDLDGYWAANYRDRPFYRDRSRWTEPREEGFVETGTFYNRLAPYGSWVWIQGQYVWVPSGVDRSWRPYTRGRWVYTDRGWTWASHEPFGWATYHYGRWGYSNRVGWFWVPGNRWAPAWVSWRESDDYLAWAPMPPASDGGININVSIGSVPSYYWQVVPSRSFLADDLQGQIVRDRNRQRPILDRSRPLGNTTITNNNVVVNNNVNVTYVEEKTNEKVVEHRIRRTRDAKAAGKIDGRDVEIFQPSAAATAADVAPPAPKPIAEVAKESQTKDQAGGEAGTEEMLVPPEIKKARGGRKAGEAGKGAKPKDGETTLPPSLPKGEEASAPPPLLRRSRRPSRFRPRISRLKRRKRSQLCPRPKRRPRPRWIPRRPPKRFRLPMSHRARRPRNRLSHQWSPRLRLKTAVLRNRRRRATRKSSSGTTRWRRALRVSCRRSRCSLTSLRRRPRLRHRLRLRKSRRRPKFRHRLRLRRLRRRFKTSRRRGARRRSGSHIKARIVTTSGRAGLRRSSLRRRRGTRRHRRKKSRRRRHRWNRPRRRG